MPDSISKVVDLLRIHVVWAHASAEGEELAEYVSAHFDGIGMERDGVAHRIPVRFASAPWPGSPALPLPVDLERAVHNVIVVLQDEYMDDDRNDWDDYVRNLRSDIARRGEVDFLIPFGSPSDDPILPCLAEDNVHCVRRDRWHAVETDEKRLKTKTRFLMHILFQIRDNLRRIRGTESPEKIFVSHAKSDGDDVASAIVDFVNDRQQDVPLGVFYDAKELNAGEFFNERFEKEISSGTLLAIVSDFYDSRPWCVYELTVAKRKRRPIVLADVGQRRVARTYPYGANLPKVRVAASLDDTAWIEELLVEVLSEGLRCDLFDRQIDRVLGSQKEALKLIRPPELLDVIDSADLPDLIVYPDPPLGNIEEEIIRKAILLRSDDTRLVTLGELS